MDTDCDFMFCVCLSLLSPPLGEIIHAGKFELYLSPSVFC